MIQPDICGCNSNAPLCSAIRRSAARKCAYPHGSCTTTNYGWLLGLIYPYVGRVRASRPSARMTERAYRQLEAAGYSRTTLRTLNLVLAKAFGEQTGRSAPGTVARTGGRDALRGPRCRRKTSRRRVRVECGRSITSGT
jgi:hypothetical protein